MHVFESLLSNAVKFSNQGGQVTVRVDRMEEKGIAYAHISVRDVGVGIDPKMLPRLFDPSVKAEGSDVPRFGGLGIGISLAREIVHSHGGKMWVGSETQKGSIFHFILPVNG
jgi:signal transduction histidine kinase